MNKIKRLILAIFVSSAAPVCCTLSSGSVSDLDWKRTKISIDRVKSNEEGLLFGFEGKDDWIETKLLRFRLNPTRIGYVLEVDNRSEFLTSVVWTKCFLIDYLGETRSIVHPAFGLCRSSADETQIVGVAPFSTREIHLIPVEAKYCTILSEQKPSFHPSNSYIQDNSFYERVFITLDFRGRELTYDTTLRFVAKK